MAEAFELVDEAAAVAFGGLGVAAAEEFLAEFVVGDAAVEDVVGGGEDLVFSSLGVFALCLWILHGLVIYGEDEKAAPGTQ